MPTAMSCPSTPARTRLRAALIAAILLLAAPAAQADALDDILGVLAKFGAIDPAIKDAKPLIQCLIEKSNPQSCFDVKAVAAQEGKAAVQKYVPTDPKILATADMVRAAQKGQWLKLVEIAGAKVLLPVACDLGLAATAGPASGVLNNFVCKGAFKQIVSKVAEPALAEILRALATGNPVEIVWKLFTLAGSIDLVCDLLPDFPGKDVPCGVFGKALAEIGGAFADTAKYGVKLAVSAADAVENLIFGSDAHIAYDTYYARYWLPWMHLGASLCLTQDCKGLGNLNKSIWDRCVDYFDSHNQYRSTAQKTCDHMRDKRFDPGVKAMADALRGGGEAHALEMRPWARMWAVEFYGKNASQQHQQFFVGNCVNALQKEFPFPSATPGQCESIKKHPAYNNSIHKPLLDKLYTNCIADQVKQSPSPTAWSTACTRATPVLMQVLQEEQARLQVALQSLPALGCLPPQGWTAAQGLQFACTSYPGHEACMTALKGGNEAKRCTVPDIAKADALRAQQIVDALGSRRCSRNGAAVTCTRPWKHDSCKAMVASTAIPSGVKSALTCRADLREYNSLAAKTAAVLAELNPKLPPGHAAAAGGPDVRICSTGFDALAIQCRDDSLIDERVTANPELALPTCVADPDQDGSDVPCYVRSRPVRPGRQAAQRDPPGCEITLTYLEPQPPRIEISVPILGPGDQFRIQCDFKRRTRQLRWPNCDDATRQLASRVQRQAPTTGRSSGIVVIDGARTAVATAPADGGDFSRQQLWSHKEAGTFTASCEVDNPLAYQVADAPTHLSAGVVYDVSARRQAAGATRFSPGNARLAPSRAVSAELVFAPGLVIRSDDRQHDAVDKRRPGGE